MDGRSNDAPGRGARLGCGGWARRFIRGGGFLRLALVILIREEVLVTFRASELVNHVALQYHRVALHASGYVALHAGWSGCSATASSTSFMAAFLSATRLPGRGLYVP